MGNDPVSGNDPNGGEANWVPGVDKEGNAIMTKQDGDTYESLVKNYGEDLAKLYDKNAINNLKVGESFQLNKGLTGQIFKDWSQTNIVDFFMNNYNYFESLKIVLLNDSVISESSQIDFSERVHFIALKHGKTKTIIKPSDTKQVYRYSSTGRKIIGIPVDTCWLFLVEKGKINSYSQFPYEAYPAIAAIQAGSGAIVPLNKKNLLAMMNSNDAKLIRLIERNKFDKAIHLYNNPVPPKATVFRKR